MVPFMKFSFISDVMREQDSPTAAFRYLLLAPRNAQLLATFLRELASACFCLARFVSLLREERLLVMGLRVLT